jgi:hypothetical protein
MSASSFLSLRVLDLIGVTPLRRSNGKIGDAIGFIQCTFMRIADKFRKTIAEFRSAITL